MPRKHTLESFKAQVFKTHGPSIKVLSKTYINSDTKMQFECEKGHTWKALGFAVAHKTGCPVCRYNNQCLTIRNYKLQLDLKFKGSVVIKNYTSLLGYVEATCNICQYGWLVKASQLLYQSGCPGCANIRTSILGKERARTIKVINLLITNPSTRLIEKLNTKQGRFKCLECSNTWETATDNVLNKGTGCPSCAKQKYLSSISNVSQVWLSKIEKEYKIYLIREYKIPNTKYFADGYCCKTNTIYEFHGDAFHGNPNRYKSDDYCHPYNKTVSAKELFNKTKLRENLLIGLNYNLVVVWEQDFNNNKLLSYKRVPFRFVTNKRKYSLCL